jgi:hypothetical protein
MSAHAVRILSAAQPRQNLSVGPFTFSHCAANCIGCDLAMVGDAALLRRADPAGFRGS